MFAPERDYANHRLKQRPDSELVQLLRATPAAFVADYLKQIGIFNTTMSGVAPLRANFEVSIAGPAITMETVLATESHPYLEAPYMHTEIVEECEAGDVLVIAGHGHPYALWGEHTTEQALKQNVSAVAIDGYIRDTRAVRNSALPVFCGGSTPQSYVRRLEPVGYNTTVICAGATVCPGDVIVGDEDGVVVVPQELLEEVVKGVHGILDTEGKLRDAVASDRPWREIYNEIHRKKYIAPGQVDGK